MTMLMQAWLLLGTLWPAYSSFKAVRTRNNQEYVERKMSRGGIVLSSREKPLEELPNLAARARAKVSFATSFYRMRILKESELFPNYQSWLNFSTKVPFKPKTPARTPRNAQRGKEKEGKKVHHHHHVLPLCQVQYFLNQQHRCHHPFSDL